MEAAFGILWALLSLCSFGSFGVPIKTAKVLAHSVDPLIFQCYKTAACFCLSILVLTYVPVRWTWWGVLGAFNWVVNGTIAIYAVQKAGLAVSQSLWSGLSLFISFFWGTYVFSEPVGSPKLALIALFVMATGMMGIGYTTMPSYQRLRERSDEEECKDLISPEQDADSKYGRWNSDFVKGTISATIIGLANGSFLVPMKYANHEVEGMEYLFSFGIGAVMATLTFLILYYIINKMIGREMPSFHCRVVAIPALTTGILWSIGNFCSIYATQILGMAVAWPLVQCQLLVSGLWGVFFYKEVKDAASIVVFFLSSAFIIAGAVLLFVSTKN